MGEPVLPGRHTFGVGIGTVIKAKTVSTYHPLKRPHSEHLVDFGKTKKWLNLSHHSKNGILQFIPVEERYARHLVAYGCQPAHRMETLSKSNPDIKTHPPSVAAALNRLDNIYHG